MKICHALQFNLTLLILDFFLWVKSLTNTQFLLKCTILVVAKNKLVLSILQLFILMNFLIPSIFAFSNFEETLILRADPQKKDDWTYFIAHVGL